jgi:hypothetical protein
VNLSRAASAVLLMLSVVAHSAEHPRARLSYSRLRGAEHCPDDESLRNAVSARLGYPAFEESAAVSIAARVSASATGLEGQVEINGKGERRFFSAERNCQELSSTMALAISIAIDPQSLTRPRPVASSSPPEVAPVPKTVPQEPESSTELTATAGAVASVASAPAVAPGFVVGIHARWHSFSIGGETRVDLPAAGQNLAGRFNTYLLIGSLLPCLHRSHFGACGVVSGGALRAAGEDLSDSRRVTLPYFALGARLQGEVSFGRAFFIRAHLEASAPVTRASLAIGETEVWANPPVCGSIGLLLGAVFY